MKERGRQRIERNAVRFPEAAQYAKGCLGQQNKSVAVAFSPHISRYRTSWPRMLHY